MPAANRIEQIYDLKTLGGAKTITELEQIADRFKEIEQVKLRLNRLKDNTTDTATIRRVTTEIQSQEQAYQRNVVKMNLVSEKTLKLASHNKELALKIIQVNDAVSDATDALNDHNKAELEAIRSAQAFYGAQKKEEQATKGTTKAVVDQTKAKQEAKILEADRLRALKNQIREELNAKGSLEQRRAALIRLRTEYDRLSPKERDTSWGKRLQSTIQGLDAQVLTLEKNTGRAQRNVGNYGSALNKVWGAFRQIAYILPGLGIAGIFNIIFDAIGPVIEKLFTFNSAHKEVISTLIEGRKASTGEVSELDRLYAKTQNVTLSIAERKKAVDKLQELYPAYFKNISDENILNGNSKTVYDDLRTSIIEVAKAKAISSKITEIINDGLEEETRLTEELNKAKAREFTDKGKAYQDPIFSSGTIENTELADKRRRALKQQAQSDLDEFKLAQKEKLEAYKKMLDKYDGVVLKQVDNSGKEQADAEAKLEKERLKAAEESQKIINDARLNLMDEMSAEMYKRAVQYLEDEKKLVNATQEQRAAVYESYQKDIQSIIDKYELKAYQDRASKEDELFKLDQEAAKRDQEAKKSNQSKLDKIDEENDKQDRARQQLKIETKSELDQKEIEAERKKQAEIKKLREQAMNYAMSLLEQYAYNQAQKDNQEIDQQYQKQEAFLATDKEKRLAAAQSAAERQAIEEEFAQKQTALERQRNIQRQEAARKQAGIEFGIATMKALVAGLEQGGIPGALLTEAFALGQYLLALKNINSQQFEDGGQVPTTTGGDITGPSHAAGGVPFGFEAEGGEMAIINKNSTMDKGTYSLTGTPRQIASAINEIGGGIRFAPGAKTMKFEYGGMLGNNLNAPMLGNRYTSSSSMGVDSSLANDMLKAIMSQNNRIDNLQVILDTRALSKQQDRTAKQVQLGTV